MTILQKLLSDTAVRFTRKARPCVTAELTDADLRTLEAHLHRLAQSDDACPLLMGVLRQKIAWSRPIRGAAPPDLATGGRLVRYRVVGAGTRCGLLSHRDAPEESRAVVAVCSLLGATLIGMRTRERVPLLRDNGTIVTLSLLDVSAA